MLARALPDNLMLAQQRLLRAGGDLTQVGGVQGQEEWAPRMHRLLGLRQHSADASRCQGFSVASACA